MRLAMAQMSMVNDIERNFNKSLQFLDLADEHKADLMFFPATQLTPFFPQYHKREVGGELNHIPDEFAIGISDEKIIAMSNRAAEYGFYVSPNCYVNIDDEYFDMSFWIDPHGNIRHQSKMVHVANAPGFYEAEYYTRSDDGFFVYDTVFGRVGIVIDYDRHFPESIRSCAVKGADLIIIPAANIVNEPIDMYERELSVAAFQNGVFIAMANRVGCEGNIEFAGASMVVGPNGNTVVKADASQQFIICNIELSEARVARERRPYINQLRPMMYQ